MMNLNIYILTNYTDFLPSGKPHSNVINAVKMFTGENSYFNIKLNLININNKDDDKEDIDYNFIKKSISMSLKINPSSYVIVCKETSISSLTSNILLQYIEKCVIKSIEEPDKSKFDIIWLSHWNSRCDQYTNYRELLNGTYLVDTTSSYGIQCLLFSPSVASKFVSRGHVCFVIRKIEETSNLSARLKRTKFSKNFITFNQELRFVEEKCLRFFMKMLLIKPKLM